MEYREREYDYEERGGAPRAAEQLDVPLHEVVKTLVFRGDDGGRMLVLMHGDREVSTKALARHLGLRRVVACSPDEALRVTGYPVGGLGRTLLRCQRRRLRESTGSVDRNQLPERPDGRGNGIQRLDKN